MAHEEVLAIRKIIIIAEVGRLPAVVDTRIRVREVRRSVVEGARIIHLVAEGDMMVEAAEGGHPRLARAMAQ